MENPILQVEGVSKRFPGVNALQKVDFDLYRGEVHALVGENGAGKSTLMNILSGIFQPNEGTIRIGGRQVTLHHASDANANGISTVFQELSLVPNLTVAENVFFARQPVKWLGIVDRKEMNRRTRELCESFGISMDPESMVKDLSVASQQIVEILKAVSYDPSILILDEPTSSLTLHETRMLFRMIKQLKDNQVGIIYISHHLEELFEISDRITVFRDGKYITTLRTEETNENEIVKLMVGREISDFFPKKELDHAEQTPLLEVRGLSWKDRFHDVDLDVYGGEILGIAGLVGAGRTELAKTLFGSNVADKGTVKLDGKPVRIHSPSDAIRKGLVYLSEDRKSEGLYLMMSIKDNIAAPNLDAMTDSGLVNEGKVQALTKELVAKINVVTPSIDQQVRNLSGGNQQKVLLSMWLATKPKILIVDEPTRGVDVGAKSEIYAILRDLADSGVAVVVISSDMVEILGISDRIMVMSEGRVMRTMLAKDATEDKIMEAASGIR